MKKRGFRLLVATTSLLSGCASYTQGVSQIVTFEISPPEAVCTVSAPQMITQTVTGKSQKLKVQKGFDALVATCTAQGYATKTLKVASSVDKLSLLSIPLDLGMTDMFTGAMWTYPEHVAIVLKQEAPSKNE